MLTKNAGNHLLALGPRKAVEKQVTPAYTGGRLPVLFFDNLNFLGSMRIESKQTLNHMSDPGHSRIRTNVSIFSLKPTTSLEKNTCPENYDDYIDKIPHEKTEQPHDDADNRFHEEHA